MAISRETKENQVKQLSEDFARSKLTVVVDYQGLTVADMQELRSLLSDQQCSLKVIKNNLIRLAVSKNSEHKGVDSGLFEGPVALAFGYEDEVAPAQVLAKFGKIHEALELKAGINADGSTMDATQVKHLASLPGKQQLRGMVVGTMAAPVSGFVNVLAGNIRGLVQVLNQHSKQKTA